VRPSRSLDADLQSDPFPPVWYWNFRGIALFAAERYEEAIHALSHLTTKYWYDYYYLAASYVHMGLIEQARACAAEILRTRPGFALGQVAMTDV
jgi:adenylate cyclase